MKHLGSVDPPCSLMMFKEELADRRKIVEQFPEPYNVLFTTGADEEFVLRITTQAALRVGEIAVKAPRQVEVFLRMIVYTGVSDATNFGLQLVRESFNGILQAQKTAALGFLERVCKLVDVSAFIAVTRFLTEKFMKP